MPVHLKLLGQLHLLLGTFGVLCGFSLVILGAGTNAALSDLQMEGPAGDVAVWILVGCGVVFVAGGLALAAAGRALGRRSRAGRLGALVLAIPNLLVIPFGTALSVYSFWVLLNDEARREFGRPLRQP